MVICIKYLNILILIKEYTYRKCKYFCRKYKYFKLIKIRTLDLSLSKIKDVIIICNVHTLNRRNTRVWM